MPTRSVGTNGSGSPSDAPVAARDPVHITIAVLPRHTSVAGLSKAPGMGIAIASAGIGSVPADQTYLDIGQGARVQESLYHRSLPELRLKRHKTVVKPAQWRAVQQRANSAPADVVPGLFGSYAVGAVRCDSRAEFGPHAVARAVVTGGGLVPDRTEVPCGASRLLFGETPVRFPLGIAAVESYADAK